MMNIKKTAMGIIKEYVIGRTLAFFFVIPMSILKWLVSIRSTLMSAYIDVGRNKSYLLLLCVIWATPFEEWNL